LPMVAVGSIGVRDETPSTELTESAMLFAFMRKQTLNDPPY
jgi:hypothetical protein